MWPSQNILTLLLLSYVVPVKSKVKISQNFVAFSEYMNFTYVWISVNVCIAVCRFNLWKWWMSKHPIFIQDVSSVFTKAIGSFGKRINSIKGICRTDWIRYLINKVGLFFKKALLSKGLKATHVRFNQRPISLNHTWLCWKSKSRVFN